MDTIRGLMQFRRAQIASLTITPNASKDPTASLKLSAELTPELAEKMRCREAVFNAEGKPHPNVTRLDLGGAILRDVDLSLPSSTMEGAFDTYRPEDIASFKIEVDGMLVRLSMLARIKGRYLELVDFLEHKNTDNFDLAIRSLQSEFDWSGKGGTGTAVDLSGGIAGKRENQGPLFNGLHATLTGPDGQVIAEWNAPCVHCDAGEPRNYTGHHMVNSELVACPRPLMATLTDQVFEAANEAGPALPPIHETNGGRRKRQMTRGDVASIEEAQRRPRNEHPEMRGDIAGEQHPADAPFPVN